jgi:hypothetical protein
MAFSQKGLSEMRIDGLKFGGLEPITGMFTLTALGLIVSQIPAVASGWTQVRNDQVSSYSGTATGGGQQGGLCSVYASGNMGQVVCQSSFASDASVGRSTITAAGGQVWKGITSI